MTTEPDTRDEIIARLTVQNEELRKIIREQADCLDSLEVIAQIILTEADKGRQLHFGFLR